MNSSYDPEVDAYYFGNKSIPDAKSVRQIYLGEREVILDVDLNGNIIGVEVL